MKTKTSFLVGGIALVGCLEVSAAPVDLDAFTAQGISSAATNFTGASSTGFTLGNGSSFDASSRAEAAFTDGAITLVEGASLTFSYNLTVTQGVDDNNNYESGWRFGFFNSAASDAKLLGVFDSGPVPSSSATSPSARVVSGTGNLNSLGTQIATSTAVGTPITSGATDLDISITIARVAGGLYDVTLDWDGTTILAEDLTVTGTLDTFDSVTIISNAGFDADSILVVSNAAVEYVVPEPGSFALIGLGCLTLLRKRRA